MKKIIFCLLFAVSASANASWTIVQDFGDYHDVPKKKSHRYMVCGLDGLAYMIVADPKDPYRKVYSDLYRLGADYDPSCRKYNKMHSDNPYMTDDVRSTIYNQFENLFK